MLILKCISTIQDYHVRAFIFRISLVMILLFFRNSTRNVKKLLDSFVFKFLDFERDFTLEVGQVIIKKLKT